MSSGDVSCKKVRAQFSSYLDCDVTGIEMQRISAHLDQCRECAAEFNGMRTVVSNLSSLPQLKAPDDQALRLRVAISNERARVHRGILPGLKTQWENAIAPLVLQASAGFASTVLLLGTVVLAVGTFASPEPVAARDVPLGMASEPHFRYSSLEPEGAAIGARDNPLIVEAYINGLGQVYDYHIVSGPNDAETRSELENTLLFSVFEPARFFGQPVRGTAVLAFTGVSVRA
jgi:anti-sigma factor RsiW